MMVLSGGSDVQTWIVAVALIQHCQLSVCEADAAILYVGDSYSIISITRVPTDLKSWKVQEC